MENENEKQTNKNTVKSHKKWIVVAVLIALLIGGWFYFGGSFSDIFSGDDSSVENDVVATVNGLDIYNAEYQIVLGQITSQAVQQGADVSNEETLRLIQEQAINSIINSELLKEEASRMSLKKTFADVEGQYNQIVENIGGVDAAESQFASVGVTVQKVKDDLISEATVQAVVDSLLEGEEFVAEEAEIQALYDEAAATGAELPAIEEVRDQITQQVIFNKEQEVIGSFIQELRDASDIEILI